MVQIIGVLSWNMPIPGGCAITVACYAVLPRASLGEPLLPNTVLQYGLVLLDCIHTYVNTVSVAFINLISIEPRSSKTPTPTQKLERPFLLALPNDVHSVSVPPIARPGS